MEFFDTHAHLDDEQFTDVRAVLQAAREAGVARVVAIGTTADSSAACVEMAQQNEGVFAAVGIQPNYTQEVTDADWNRVEKLARAEKVVAIGETGLDHYWDYAELPLQREYFRRHIRLASELKLPLVIHMRDPQPETGQTASRACAEDIYDVLIASHGDATVSGVMHSYTGDAEMSEKFLQLGLHISFAGMVTYKKSADLREVASAIPMDRILIETDAPYLSPHPVRGTRPNQPAMVRHTAACLAKVRGVSLEAFAAQTTANAARLFQLKSRVEP